jgi:hypothetical protein
MYTYPAKLQVAYVRHKEGGTWAESAAVIGAAESTIRLWDSNRDEEWERACAEVLEDMRREAHGAAWRCLVEAAKAGDVGAAKEILNRTEGAVKQTIGLGQDPNAGPLRHDHHMREVVSNERARRALCDLVEAVAGGEGDAGGVCEGDESGPVETC